ncbi:MAG: choloylglycine hydrolase [Clostridia bacterium]|nr:choloylglycine hydrolase [Clostridia bacterium]
MCTSIALTDGGFCFGRNMDLEYTFGERVVYVPRSFPFSFRKAGRMDRHYAIIGMAAVMDGYPLFADGMNEKGLCIAGLNFPENAYYPEEADDEKENVSPFELIPYLLGRCASVKEARELLEKTRLVLIHFREDVLLTPLHWHIADREESIVLEAMRDGMHIRENPVGVMTNSPPLDFHLTNLRQYLNLTVNYPGNRFGGETKLKPFGVGLGSIGLPGDYSPVSRFVRAAFLKMNSVSGEGTLDCLTRCMHLMDAVAMPDGIVQTPDGRFEKTSYSCCMDADRGVYYYKTYENSCLTAVDMQKENPEGREISEFPLRREQQIAHAN